MLPRIVVLLAALSAPLHSAAAEFALPERGICAHRGASTTHPENTRSALREAIRLGAHMLEFDVALTKDHRVVLMHDTTVDRTTTGSGRVSDFTLDELKQLDAGSWKGKAFAGARVPRLSEVLAMVPQNIWLNVHLKGDRLLAEKTAGELRDSDRLHQSFLACDNQSAQAAKDIVPSIQICNMERQAESDLYAENTLQQGTEFIQLLSRRPKSLAHIPRLRQHRVKINFCCTNQREQLSELLARGVDFVLVEEVKPMVAQAETLGIQRLKPKYAKD